MCRRGYFIEGMGGAQFALPGAVERLRASPVREKERPRAMVLAAADPAQPYGAALPWPRREEQERRPRAWRGIRGHRARGARPVRRAGWARAGHAGRRRLAGEELGGEPISSTRRCSALADAVRAGRVGKLSLERIDGEPAIASTLLGVLWSSASRQDRGA